jgi:diguanylate cyclase (GGDEF)-like protein
MGKNETYDSGPYRRVRGTVNDCLARLPADHPAFLNPADLRRALPAARLAAFTAVNNMTTRLDEAQARTRTAQAITRTDPFTKLENRRGYDETVRAGLQRAHRLGRPATLLMLDLNNIDVVNVEQGRAEGDRWILGTAAILTRNATEDERPARWGGDEYCLLRRDASGSDTEAWWTDVSAEFAAAQIHISAGAATYQPDIQSEFDLEARVTDLSDRADEALSHAKAASKQSGGCLLRLADCCFADATYHDLSTN